MLVTTDQNNGAFDITVLNLRSPLFEVLPPTLPQGANNLTIKVHKLDQHKSA
jgi:hypothetical protein